MNHLLKGSYDGNYPPENAFGYLQQAPGDMATQSTGHAPFFSRFLALSQSPNQNLSQKAI